MSQNDMTIANQGFPATRTDINSALQALASTSSGATEPSTMFANQLWFDTAANKLKIRNEANSAWYDIVEINESTGALTIAVGAGAAATPSLTTTGDTNTGIFFPAADTIAFAEGGAEAMRINSSGNVGIGTASPSSPLNVVAASGSGLAIAINGRSSDNTGAMYLYANNGTTQQATIIATATEFRLSSVPAAAVQTFYTNAIERMRIDASGNLLFNSGYGSAAVAYGCRAWVNFNGTGTVAIRGSGNVTSITDNGVGDYTVNFTTALVDANYGYAGTAGNGGNDVWVTAPYVTAPTVSAFRVVALLGNRTALDCSHFSVTIFR